VRVLYEDVGLPVFQMTLLLGLGMGAVRSGLKRAGVELRAASEPAPWTSRQGDEDFVRLCPSEVEKRREMTTSVANLQSSLSPGTGTFLPVDDLS
jgi:hypothetical protein